MTPRVPSSHLREGSQRVRTSGCWKLPPLPRQREAWVWGTRLTPATRHKAPWGEESTP